MICRGQWPTHESTASEATHELGGYWDWSSRRACKESYCLDMGRGQPKNHLAEQFAISLHCHFLTNDTYVGCCNLGLISTIFSKQFLTSTTLAMAMVASWYFFGPLHRPIPVRCTWNVFARKMHSTTEFAMTVLSKCVTHVGSIRCRGPLGEYLSR